MSEKPYGSGAPLSYNEYLRVPDLIELQNCLSDPAHHDELLFITVHQTYEIWFKQILHEIDAAIAALNADRPPLAARALLRIVEIEKILVNQIHILETMTPLNFLGFRDELNPASGFQSTQFREIEFSSGLKDEALLRAFADDDFATRRLQTRFDAPTLADAFFAFLARRGFEVATAAQRTRAALEVLTHFEERDREFQIAEGLIAHDEYFGLWRVHHVRMVERMMGTKRGTGGSEGVGYLRTTLDKKFYPELWAARTHLGAGHDGGAAGCPFAGQV
ncbi:MAG TPA: tryptophan 2,3-dioxygenase family protein [Pyrinomonadaceae bacterium]|jgi:tryptophan 2,3-dioxygenase|nr:tryptophan 2,3-dioxygenase family protein [Pyrinomonadaceae bacterium]